MLALVGVVSIGALSLAVPSVSAAAQDPPPANDDFANAEVLAGSQPITVNGTNVDATKESGEPDHAVSGGGASVWYRWTAPADDTVRIDTCGDGTNFDTVLAVYTGSSVGSLNEVAYDDDLCANQSALTFEARAGRTYRIAVDGFSFADPGAGPSQGNFVLKLDSAPPPPPNDDFANAQELTGSLPITVNGTNVSATQESGEPDHGGAGTTSVWYSWTAPTDATVQVGSCGEETNFDTTTAVYTGTSVESLTEQGSIGGCAVDTVLPFSATAGTTYKIAVSGGQDDEGDFVLRLWEGSDDFALGGVARQSDGKLVAAGYSGENFAVARYNTNGSLDTSFAGDGMQTTDFGGADFGHAIAIQPNGRIVVAGRIDERNANDWGVARYNSDGSLDTSFSGDGKKTTDFGFMDSAYGVVMQPDGKIVVAGLANANDAPDPAGDFGLARYNRNGSLDSGFSGDGKLTTDFGGLDGALEAVIQSDGKIVAGGTTNARKKAPSRRDDDFALARYNVDGTLDTSYSGDGKQRTDFGAFDAAEKIAIQPDGKVVAAGSTATAGDGRLPGFERASDPGGGPTSSDSRTSDFALARYNLNGTLDAGFGNGGKKTTDISGGDEALAVAIQPDGKIMTAGVANAFRPNANFGLARYRPNGALDTGFSGDGKKTTDFGGYDAATGSIAFQPNGRIVVAGGTIAEEQDFALARYSASGGLDTSFDGDGLVTTDFP